MKWIEYNGGDEYDGGRKLVCKGIIDRCFPGSYNDSYKDEEMKGKTDLIQIYKTKYGTPVRRFMGIYKWEVCSKYYIHYNLQSFPMQTVSGVTKKAKKLKESYWDKMVIDATLEDAKKLAIETIKNYINSLNEQL